MKAIKCEKLIKNYEIGGVSKNVLKIESLEIEEGSFFGILGPNGAGKSTLINIVTSLIKPTSGSVKIFGKEISQNIKFAKMSVGTAVQDVKLDPFPKIWESLEFQAGYYGIQKSERKTEEILHNLGLYEHRNKKARMLSGGMQRRLVIAKALVHDPKIIILDEPTAGVDIELRTQLWKFIFDLKKKGKTVIITTHYLEEAQQLCEEIAFIKAGQIALQDKKSNVLSLIDKKTALIKTQSQIPENLPSLEISKTENGMRVRYVPSQIKTIEVLQMLQSSGVVVEDLTIKDVCLDEVFSYIINH